MSFHTLTIVGVGLIGGSIGLAAKKRGLVERVIGVGRAAAKLENAKRLGAIDDGSLDLAEAVRAAELVVFCAPVDCIAAQLVEAAPHAQAGAVFTDAGSAKQAIVQAAEGALSKGVSFVGAHPLAGSEKKGAEHACADLFVDRWTVLTPTERTPAPALESVRTFWQALGSRVRIMSPRDHDEALALTSHLPHLVASALAGMLPDDLYDLTATGFRDTTRVAAGDADVWTPIFRQNQAAVLAALDKVLEGLRLFRAALAESDAQAIDRFLIQGKKVRDALGN